MNTPKIRFKGFEDDWEQCKFEDVGTVAMCKRIFKEQTSEEGEVPFYKIGTFGGMPDAYITRELFEEYKKNYQYPNKYNFLEDSASAPDVPPSARSDWHRNTASVHEPCHPDLLQCP